MIFAFLYLLIIILDACTALPVSSRPVALYLRRVALSNATGLYKDRTDGIGAITRPDFFSNVLGLAPGQPFHFDLDKWRQIQRCGLFSNLTARVLEETGQVRLNITGIELPAITISPEVSVAASLERPEMSGGIKFVNKNFRGLGERLNIVFAKKEGIEDGTDTLSPNIKVLWTDNSIGKMSSVSIGFEEEHSLEDIQLLIPRFKAPLFPKKGQIMPSRRPETMSRKGFVKLRQRIPIRNMNRFSALDTTRSPNSTDGNILSSRKDLDSDDVLTIEMQPYGLLHGTKLWGGDGKSRDGSMLYYGTHSSMSYASSKNRNSIFSLWHDGGKGALKQPPNKKSHTFTRTSHPYNSIGFDLSLPKLDVFEMTVPDLGISSAIKKYRETVIGNLPRWNKREKAGSSATAAPSLSTISSNTANSSYMQQDQVSLYAKLKLKGQMSWGESCTPLFHSISLGDSMTVRGHVSPIQPEDGATISAIPNQDRVYTYLGAKSDLYIGGGNGRQSNFIPGVFFDAAISPREGTCLPFFTTASVGASVRWNGLRVDAGYPITSLRRKQRGGDLQAKAVRFYFGIDGGD